MKLHPVSLSFWINDSEIHLQLPPGESSQAQCAVEEQDDLNPSRDAVADAFPPAKRVGLCVQRSYPVRDAAVLSHRYLSMLPHRPKECKIDHEWNDHLREEDQPIAFLPFLQHQVVDAVFDCTYPVTWSEHLDNFQCTHERRVHRMCAMTKAFRKFSGYEKSLITSWKRKALQNILHIVHLQIFTTSPNIERNCIQWVHSLKWIVHAHGSYMRITPQI
mmetsp:Transcript_15925/g.43111  ORF Transcript_15925/g.43111 Transcript_15925/m.43111 type:complete len:218 (-) Transcript_15925:1847-2500(-)